MDQYKFTAKAIRNHSGKNLIRGGKRGLSKFKRAALAKTAEQGGIAGRMGFGIVVPNDPLKRYGSGVVALSPAGMVRAGATRNRAAYCTR